MAKSKVDITGINTNDLKVLSNKEMNDLFFKLSCGDKNAKEKLVNGNLKLVLSLLKKFNNRSDNMDDLFQIGCIGLIKAIDNFDLSHNVKFSTYAVPMILGEVKRYLRDNNSLRISRSIKDIAYKTIKLKDELTTRNGVEPTNEEVAKLLGVDEIDIALALDSLKEPVSMFEPIYNDGGDTIYLSDQLEDKKENINSWDISIYLKDAIDKLKAKERKILIDRYLMGKTQVEISEEIGISQAQVSRLEKDAIKNVKKLIK
ncbi:MAG: RNA polymerase sporulation sigma factor SigG [Bacilli bacterium]|nr:RNA polymerase sporulation sigma factor SigG [Bacilli bacterium]MBQ6282683.1 RNA polymerase sporulation sigma factor SigG [Bacilli bacterium]